MNNKLKVCVIIPAYNEAAVISGVVNNAQTIFSKSKYNITIVVVNDGSKDNTSVEAREAGAVVVDHILNRGAGGATHRHCAGPVCCHRGLHPTQSEFSARQCAAVVWPLGRAAVGQPALPPAAPQHRNRP